VPALESDTHKERSALPWIFLAAAILFEGRRHHFDEAVARAVGAFAVHCGSRVLSHLSNGHSLALKRLELSTAYAIWSGVGTALAATIGIAYFREPLTLFKLASLALVILGVIGLSLAARQTN
jgi:small multidrug resistance pump